MKGRKEKSGGMMGAKDKSNSLDNTYSGSLVKEGTSQDIFACKELG